MSLDQGKCSPGGRGSGVQNQNHNRDGGLELISRYSSYTGHSPASSGTPSLLNLSVDIAESIASPSNGRRTTQNLIQAAHHNIPERTSSRYEGRKHSTSSSSGPGSPASTTAKGGRQRESSTPPSSVNSSRRGSQQDEAVTSSSNKQPRTTRGGGLQRQQSNKSARRSGSISDESALRRRPSRKNTMPSGTTAKMPKNASTNVQEALALHERSRKIFAEGGHVEDTGSLVNSASPSTLDIVAHPDLLASEAALRSLQRSKSTPQTRPRPPPPPLPPHPPARLPTRPGITRTATEPYPRARPSTSHQERPAAASEDALPTHLPSATTKYWTSDETRRREYAAIDRRNKGIRGFWNKILPKLGKKSNKSKFYDADDASDAGSVRRYRITLDSEEA